MEVNNTQKKTRQSVGAFKFIAQKERVHAVISLALKMWYNQKKMFGSKKNTPNFHTLFKNSSTTVNDIQRQAKISTPT